MAYHSSSFAEEDSEGSDKEHLSPNRNFSNPEFVSRQSPLIDGGAGGAASAAAVTSGSTGDLMLRAQSPLIYSQTSAPAAAGHSLGGRASAFTRQTSLNSLDADDGMSFNNQSCVVR